MRAETQTISIEAPAGRVMAFLSDAANLPRWAVGFARSVRRQGDGWIVETGAGDLSLTLDADPRTGTVDYRMSSPGGDSLAASRVVPRGAACEYVFTQFQNPGMSDDAFAASGRTLAHELTVLKALMEVECPL